MINVITIEREYGSGAGGIAKALAERLGWKLWDGAITDAIAQYLHCDKRAVEKREERVDPLYYRLVKAFMRGSYEASMDGQRLEILDSENLAELFEKIVTDAANQGKCVIVGRAAPWFLREREDTFRAFIYAPYEEKIRRTIALGKSQEEAEHLIDTVDRKRASFVKKYYDKEWPDRSIYHIMLNSQVGDEDVIRLILADIEMLNESAAKHQAGG